MVQEPDPSTLLGRLSLRARRVPAYIRLPLVFLGFLGSLVCLVLDLPPYSVFVDAQASVMHGEHYPMLSWALTAIVFLLPIGLFIHLIAGSFPDNTPPGLTFQEPLPPHFGPPPAYMQGGPYAQPLYGQPPPGQAPHGQAPHGQAPYGQAPYGQAPYGQAPYGQAPYGQPPPGQAPHGQAPSGRGGPGQPIYPQPQAGQGPSGQDRDPTGQAPSGSAPQGPGATG